MAEGYKHEAGGDYEAFKICVNGREQFSQKEAINDTGGAVYPGEALEYGTDAEGNRAFTYHSGNADAPLYIAVEFRAAGMNANTDIGYEAGDNVIAVRATGGALNVKLADGETVVIGDEIGVDSAAADGTFTATSADYNFVFGEVDEDLDLSGASAAELVETEVSN
jgi:hypothetical protein